MFYRVFYVFTFALCSLTTVTASSQIPRNLPETRAVYDDLNRLRSECDQAIRMAQQLRGAVASVRKGVDQSIDVTTAIRAMDKRLVKLIDQLKPYASVPKVRTATRTLSKNLQRIQAKLHDLRVKTDRCETKILRPSKAKLRELEASLLGAETKLRGISSAASTWMANLASAAHQAQAYSYARQALEASSRAARPATRSVVDAVVTARKEADAIGYKLNSVNQHFASFRTVGNSLDEMSDKMKKGEKMAGDLDKALSKTLTIKIPLSKKSLSFSIREILEKPGQVLNVVLKPLEKLADAVLQPILSKLKLEIQPPKGLEDLSRRMDSIDSDGMNLSAAIDRLERRLRTDLERQINLLRSKAGEPLQIVRNARPNTRPQPVQPQPVQRPDRPAPDQQQQQQQQRKLPAMFLSFG